MNNVYRLIQATSDDRIDFAELSLPAKLTSWGIHMGVMVGLANQIVLFLLAVVLAAMVILGYLMWWKRRPARDSSKLMGSPPRRALPKAPWWGVGSAGIAAAIVGFSLPLVGWTLLAFVILDTFIGYANARRSRRI